MLLMTPEMIKKIVAFHQAMKSNPTYTPKKHKLDKLRNALTERQIWLAARQSQLALAAREDQPGKRKAWRKLVRKNKWKSLAATEGWLSAREESNPTAKQKELAAAQTKLEALIVFTAYRKFHNAYDEPLTERKFKPAQHSFAKTFQQHLITKLKPTVIANVASERKKKLEQTITRDAALPEEIAITDIASRLLKNLNSWQKDTNESFLIFWTQRPEIFKDIDQKTSELQHRLLGNPTIEDTLSAVVALDKTLHAFIAKSNTSNINKLNTQQGIALTNLTHLVISYKRLLEDIYVASFPETPAALLKLGDRILGASPFSNKKPAALPVVHPAPTTATTAKKAATSLMPPQPLQVPNKIRPEVRDNIIWEYPRTRTICTR